MNVLSKIKISDIIAIIWFVFAVLPSMLFLAFVPMMVLMDIDTVLSSGFSTVNMEFMMLGVACIPFGITMMVPCFRKCFEKLPWLFPFIIVLIVDTLIITIGFSILNFGYEVQSESRHTLFFALMIVQIVLCRIGMSVYFKLKPLNNIKE